MFKTTLAVMLLSAAQNAHALERRGGGRRRGRLSREELAEKVEEELATGDYEIGSGLCSQRRVEQFLGQYFQKEHRCNKQHGAESRRPNEDRLEDCLRRNEMSKDQKLG